MGEITEFIKGHFSGYTMLLVLLSAWLLIFVDRVQFVRKGLKRESKFSFIAGIVYASIAAIAFVIGIITSIR